MKRAGIFLFAFLAGLFPSKAQSPLLSFLPSGSAGPGVTINGNAGALLLGGKAGPLVFLERPGKKGREVPAPRSLRSLPFEKGLLLAGRFQGGRKFTLKLAPAGPDQVRLSLKVEKKRLDERAGLCLALEGKEALYGLLERVVDGNQRLSWKPGIRRALDLRGMKVRMRVLYSLAVYEPFLVSTRGWSLLVKGTWPGRFDLGAAKEDTLELAFRGPSLEVRFHLPGTPLACVRALALRAGPPFLPPRWALGPFRWRDNHSNPPRFFDGTLNRLPFNTLVVEDILMMEALGIPCTVYWVDRPWAEGTRGYGSLRFDRKRLPNPEGMIGWLEKKGIRFLLWLGPWVCDEPLTEARKLRYLLPKGMGLGGKAGLVDFSNPAAVSWWQGKIAPLVKAGVAGFKLDRADEIVGSGLDALCADGRTLDEVHNDYPRLYLDAAAGLLSRLRGGDWIAMPRAGYTGSQKSGIFWGGDIKAGPWGLRTAIIALQRLAFMGFPYFGSDTGGYWGPWDRENFARWVAFSAFCPVMEVGPTHDRAPWSRPRPPRYDVRGLAAWRFYGLLRVRMAGYLAGLAREAHLQGVPLVRPLAMLWPKFDQAVKNWDEFLLGPDLLVCPVWRNKVTRRKIWLPPGEWVDAWDGKVEKGPAFLSVPCPLPRIPLFLRKGSPLVLGDLPALWAESLQAVTPCPNLEELQGRAFTRMTQEGPPR